MHRRKSWLLLAAPLVIAAPLTLDAQPPGGGGGGFGRMETRALAEPFKGVTTNGTVTPGLYSIRSTGVSTEPVVRTATAFIAALTEEQRGKTQYAVDDDEWRKWANVHAYPRQGVSFDEMAPAQKAAAHALFAASLSAKGLKLSEDIMHLNETLAELNDDNFEEYGEGKYYLTVMGTPSAQEPWGWQVDGHHLIINYFVLGDQVVMTPSFWGSEPAVATAGKYAGTSIMDDEQRAGLAMVRSLTPQQRERAVLEPKKTGNNIRAQLFSDNVVIDYAGVPVGSFTASQKQQLLDLVSLYVGNLRDEHARVHLADVEARLDDTYFAWVGETERRLRLLLPHPQPRRADRVRSPNAGGPHASVSARRAVPRAHPRRRAHPER